jgi:uncharacterized protein (TIGR03067 family)
MTTQTLLVLATCTPLAAGQPRADGVKQEWKKLEGTWTLTKMEANGTSLLEKDKPVPKVVIKDGKIMPDPKDAGGADAADASKIQLDPTRKPTTITIPNFEGGDPKQGVTLIGIYELEGDELKVCAEAVETAKLKEREKERPTAFDSKQGLLLVFQREKK